MSSPQLVKAMDVMWEISIEAEDDAVARSCGVFVTSFYMKLIMPAGGNAPNYGAQVANNLASLLQGGGNGGGSSGAANSAPGSSSSRLTDKWGLRGEFVQKCMDCIQMHGFTPNIKAINRCLDLLETFVECTKPGVMTSNPSGNAALFADGDSSDDFSGFSGGDDVGLDIGAHWDLGKFSVRNWKLPLGRDSFVKLNINSMLMNKGAKQFPLIVNKHWHILELRELIAAMVNSDKNYLQMNIAQQLSLQPANDAQTISSLGIIEGTTITVMALYNPPISQSFVPDAGSILSQQKFYLDIFTHLLDMGKSLAARVWNLVMRLPLNTATVTQLREIRGFLHDEIRMTPQGGQQSYTTVVQYPDWDSFIVHTSPFKLLYHLLVLDATVNHASSSQDKTKWMNAFVMLRGVDHLQLIYREGLKFDHRDEVVTFASLRSLYLLSRIFGCFTSHALTVSQVLYVNSTPTQTTPMGIKSSWVSGMSSYLTDRHASDLIDTTVNYLFRLVLMIEEQVTTGHEPDKLFSDVIEFMLHQFTSFLYEHSDEMESVFDKPSRDEQSVWMKLFPRLLLCLDKGVRRLSKGYFVKIVKKYHGSTSDSSSIRVNTLLESWSVITGTLVNIASPERGRCLEFMQFYSEIIEYYCAWAIVEDANFHERFDYFMFVFKNTVGYIVALTSRESSRNDDPDEWLIGLFSVASSCLKAIPTLRKHSRDRVILLRDHLIRECLFDYPKITKEESILSNLTVAPPSIPKCRTSRSRRAAFNLILEICRGYPRLWGEVLRELSTHHQRFVDDIIKRERGIHWDFNPFLRARSPLNHVGLYNYGCTCYLNATFQQLNMNPIVKKIFLETNLNDVFPLVPFTPEIEEKKGSDDDEEDDVDENEEDDEDCIMKDVGGGKIVKFKSGLKKSVVFALQELFGFLKYSKRRAAWPSTFIENYRGFDGNRINVHEQMDAQEFLNFLFDRAENELKGTVAEKLLKEEFCGKQVNQIICQKCGYVSENPEPIYALPAQIQNHSRLEECLESHVKGEYLQGANAYRCVRCDDKVKALKRSCFTTLPHTLMIHLKRFEFNLENMSRIKINDEMSFPIDLDMTKYCKEYLDLKEKRIARAVSDEVENHRYELVGIVIHDGMATVGHYYSYVREQYDDGSLGQWLEFNDDTVKKFDERTIPEKCYGGSHLQYHRVGTEYKQRMTPKPYNAYLLVYRRKGQLNPHMTLDNTLLSQTIAKEEKPDGVRVPSRVEKEGEDVVMKETDSKKTNTSSTSPAVKKGEPAKKKSGGDRPPSPSSVRNIYTSLFVFFTPWVAIVCLRGKRRFIFVFLCFCVFTICIAQTHRAGNKQ